MLTTELTTIKTNLAVVLARLQRDVTNYHRFGLPECPCDITMYKELMLYAWTLSFWQQYSDGTPVPNVNYITLEEFNIMINRVKFLIET
jgi:hypothetical protein